jgi:hypothetical protein
MGQVYSAMGFCIARTPQGTSMCHIQPAALTDTWSLRHAAPLITPRAQLQGLSWGYFYHEGNA